MDLIQQIVNTVGVNEQQAKGGAGLLFKLAQDKLAAGDFAKLSQALPEVVSLITSAPPASGGGLLGSLAGALGGGSLGGLASLAGALTSLKLDPQTISQFVPVILDVVKQKGGPELAAMLGKLLPAR
ncbi:MAG TPA: DUF2780 domain-containing protein [Kiritimatiellia bacterium]|nr:DUF2780 domain-containing protein [Kiritimatiellia bacterium]HMP34278.1 DUF2780 domain-containing protein [Kiritimatiellia bacterium]